MKTNILVSVLSGLVGSVLIPIAVSSAGGSMTRESAFGFPLARSQAAAAASTRLTYQGRLMNSVGAPLTSAVNIVFKLYDDAGTVQWTSATRTITPTNGLFTVYLGDAPDPVLADELFGAASIGVTVGADSEMTPRQPLNTVVGHSETYFGVLGTSSTGLGVQGVSNTGIGVLGHAISNTGIGVAATGSGTSGTALQIYNGAIKVLNAGIGTNTAVFVHQVGAGDQGGCINHPMLNDAANAILFVTPRNVLFGIPPSPVGVLFIPAAQFGCPAGQWKIYSLDATQPLAQGQIYNVMIIKP